MNREIKFRGLTVNGDWVYGDLTHDAPNSTVYYKDGITARIHWSEGKTQCNMPVKDETVGEFTGLKDKTWKEIYEGDLIRTDGFSDGYSVPVVWHNCMFQMGEHGICPLYSRNDYEVIGNIWENPELLK